MKPLIRVVAFAVSAWLLVLAPGVLSAGDAAPRLAPPDEQGRHRYLVRFEGPGALAEHASLGGRAEAFALANPRARAALDRVRGAQEDRLRQVARALGRAVEPSHRFLATHNGAALWLEESEAARLQALPFVAAVERERVLELATYRGPEFIGAGSVWTGAAVPGGSPLRGEGMIVAVLDTGIPIPRSHPSFADDPNCGHGEGGNPSKVLSMLDCSETDADGLCNGPDPVDRNGHGAHVASTAAGNLLDEDQLDQLGFSPPGTFDSLGGVAPCAHIRSYKVCPANQCPGADIFAGLQSVLLYGDASVANFSISGGLDPWKDLDRVQLDLVGHGILVAAAAGNDDAVGSVNHRGPWMTTVAASTRDVDRFGQPVPGDVLASFSSRGPTPPPLEHLQKPDLTAPGVDILAALDVIHLLSAAGPGTPPDELEYLLLLPGSDTPLSAAPFAGRPIRFDPGQPAGADGCQGFPGGFFDGAVALVRRGGCNFTDKINHAFSAGADFIVIHNNQTGLVSMNTAGQEPGIEAFSLAGEPGEALREFIDHSGGQAEVDFLIPPAFGFLSGTSMATPHVAGAAALVRQARPDWTPMEVHSALKMTTQRDGFKSDGQTPWDPDDVGSGRVDLTRAALAGLVMDETYENFLAADPAAGGDPRTLNLPALRDVDCQLECAWTRVLRNTLDEPAEWTVTASSGVPGLEIEVDPAGFFFSGAPEETVALTITARVTGELPPGPAFGEVVFVESGEKSPALRWTTAVAGEPSLPPEAAVFPESLEFDLGPNETAAAVLALANLGDPDYARPLQFSMKTAEETGDCAESAEPGWFEALPAAGEVAPGAEIELEVRVGPAGQGTEVLEARLCLETSDPARPLIEVPVTVRIDQDLVFRDAFGTP